MHQNVAKDDDTDDDYFGFTESTDGTPSATDSYLSQTLHSATKFELEALNFLEEPRKDIDVLRSYPTMFALMLLCLRLPLWNGYSASQALSHVHIAEIWETKCLRNCCFSKNIESVDCCCSLVEETEQCVITRIL